MYVTYKELVDILKTYKRLSSEWEETKKEWFYSGVNGITYKDTPCKHTLNNIMLNDIRLQLLPLDLYPILENDILLRISIELLAKDITNYRPTNEFLYICPIMKHPYLLMGCSRIHAKDPVLPKSISKKPFYEYPLKTTYFNL